jgi:excisionase family DNA binding protein
MQSGSIEVDRLVYSVEEAGRLVGISRATAYLMAAQGRIPTLRFGRRLVVPKAALDKMLVEAGKPGTD